MLYLLVSKKKNPLFLVVFSIIRNAVFNGEREKDSIILRRVGYKNPSLRITVCHHSASLVMPNCDPRDRFFYPTLTLMIEARFFYKLIYGNFIQI